MYTDEFIKYLVECPKRIVDSPKFVKEGKAGITKRRFTLLSIDGAYEFIGFITQNDFFKENFSIGLMHNPKDEKGTTVLIRCNGLHGGIIKNPHHASFHIHWANAERISKGLKAEGEIRITQEYATLETAIQYFVRYIAITPEDRQRHFPPPSGQVLMFGQEQ